MSLKLVGTVVMVAGCGWALLELDRGLTRPAEVEVPRQMVDEAIFQQFPWDSAAPEVVEQMRQTTQENLDTVTRLKRKWQGQRIAAQQRAESEIITKWLCVALGSIAAGLVCRKLGSSNPRAKPVEASRAESRDDPNFLSTRGSRRRGGSANR